jgi:hypothetical protein
MRGLNLLFALLANAIPLIGVRYYGWSVSTVVLLYWFHSLLGVLFTCARIALHRRLTRKRGHWRNGTLGTLNQGVPCAQTLLGEYATIAGPQTVFLGMLIATMAAMAADRHSYDPRWALSIDEVLAGMLAMSAAVLVEFLVDAVTLRMRSFAWVKQYAGRRLGSALILQLIFLVAATASMLFTDPPIAMLYMMIALMTFCDLVTRGAGTGASPFMAAPLALAIRMTGANKGWTWDTDEIDIPVAADEEVMPA